MKLKLNEQNGAIAIGDTIITDPQIATQMVQVQKQITERLKKIAQFQSEIATFNQNINALKDKAIQMQKVQQSTVKEVPKAPETTSDTQKSNEGFIMPLLKDFLNEENNSSNEQDEEYDNDDYFFVKIPAQNQEDGDVIAKVFKEQPGEEWYVRDISNEAEWLEDLVFEKNYSKPEIIDYLGSMFGEVIELDQEEYDDIIDNKDELDDELYSDDEEEDIFSDINTYEKNIRYRI